MSGIVLAEDFTLSGTEEEIERTKQVEADRLRRTAPVGPWRPADSVEARLGRIEQLLRSVHAQEVLTPEEAVIVADYDDEQAKKADREQKELAKAGHAKQKSGEALTTEEQAAVDAAAEKDAKKHESKGSGK